ncbi:MAG: SUMF1/EgtB/PvdO family nonheme iron enzyme [Polyangiaceae bacterium]
MNRPHLQDSLGIAGTVVAEKYRVDQVIGEGGFSVVYRAEHIIWKQPVALKCFKVLANVPPKMREELLSGFIQEGKLMTSLSSRTAAIVQARDVGTFQARDGSTVPYMVLEWLEGRSLDVVLSAENGIGLPARQLHEVMALFEPVASALDTVHALNIAHRDIKPANLFVIGDARSPNAFMKILDFGIAKVMAEHAQLATALAQTGQEITAFTPNYGAPEQFSRTHGATGPWTDVFALALIMVEMVRGGVPALQGNDYLQLAVASRDPMVRPTPRAFGINVNDAVEAVFAKALAISPKDRFRTAGEFWSALRKSVYPSEPTWLPQGQGGAPDRLSIPGGMPASGYSYGQTGPRTPVQTPPTGVGAGAAPSNPNPTNVPVAAPATPQKSGSNVVLFALIGMLVLGGGAAGLYFGVLKKSTAPVTTASAEPSSLVAAAPSGSASATPPPIGPESCPSNMAFVPGGQFFMGTDNQEKVPALTISQPAHKVTLSPYCIDIYEVTAKEYKECSDAGGCKRARTAPEYPKPEKLSEADYQRNVTAYSEFCNFDKPGRENHPINCVTWDLASAYCKNKGGRLPTEAEWEFAARGSDGRKFPWGDQIGNDKDHMNAAGLEFSAWEKSKGMSESARMYDQDDGFPGTAPVGSFKAGKTKFGLYDMVGNVWEWTNDYFGSYSADEQTDPTGARDGDKHAMRGGGFNGGYEAWLDPAFRYFMPNAVQSHGIGFRCAKPLR